MAVSGVYIMFYLSIRFFMYFCLKMNNTLILMLLLLFTNSNFLLLITVCAIDFIKKLLNKPLIFDSLIDRVLYVFLEIGLQRELVIFSLIGLLVLQILYACTQPFYKFESSRLALELITVIFAVLSGASIIYSNDIAQILLGYMNSGSRLGIDFFSFTREQGLSGLDEINSFKTFIDNTFKSSIVPLTICSAIALAIFKYREKIGKSKANSYYQQLTMGTTNLALEQKLNLLRKVIYYGGGSLKNDIANHPHLRSITLKYLMDNSKNKGTYNVKLNSLQKRLKRRNNYIKYTVQANQHIE